MTNARKRLEGHANDAALTLVELLKSESESVALRSAELILKCAGLLKDSGDVAGLERWREVLLACLKTGR